MFKINLCLLLSLISVSSFSQVISHNNAKSSDKPTGRGNTIIIKDYMLPLTEYGAMVVLYKTGSRMKVDSIKINDKVLSMGQVNHVGKATSGQGIILVGLGKNEKVIRGDITIYLNGTTMVRGAIACTYENVDLLTYYHRFVSASTDSLSSIQNIVSLKGCMVIDCIGAKIADATNYSIVPLSSQKIIQSSVQIKGKISGSQQFFSASEMLIRNDEVVKFGWNSSTVMHNGMHQYIILKGRD